MIKYFLTVLMTVSLVGCMPPGEITRPELPSLAYTRGLHQQRFQGEAFRGQEPQVQPAYNPSARASYRFVKDLPPEERGEDAAQRDMRAQNGDMISNMKTPSMEFSPQLENAPYKVSRNTNPNIRAYQSPLHLGEPGASASLWRAQGTGSRLFRDHRAFQAMDLVTIVVSENAVGKKKADTDSKKESTFLAGIASLFNFDTALEAANPGLDTGKLLDANFSSDFKGGGETTREGSLTARIAAMVVEVLPNGVMRVEGEKVISVNNEEQVLILSGLVRPKDVNSKNEVQSSKIAHLRIDYFGKGMLGDAQYVGWFGRMVNALWPF